MSRWTYLTLKWQAIGWILIGRQSAALECFDRMLAGKGDDAYALASRAHLRAQLGDGVGALQDYALLNA